MCIQRQHPNNGGYVTLTVTLLHNSTLIIIFNTFVHYEKYLKNRALLEKIWKKRVFAEIIPS